MFEFMVENTKLLSLRINIEALNINRLNTIHIGMKKLEKYLYLQTLIQLLKILERCKKERKR